MMVTDASLVACGVPVLMVLAAASLVACGAPVLMVLAAASIWLLQPLAASH